MRAIVIVAGSLGMLLTSCADARPAATADGCVSPDAGAVRLTGIVRKQPRLGPPGYGETPAIDEKMSILVLELPASIAVCHEPVAGNEARVVQAREIQMDGSFDPALVGARAGTLLTVYGSVHHHVLGVEFTDVIIAVDSIPELRGRGRTSG